MVIDRQCIVVAHGGYVHDDISWLTGCGRYWQHVKLAHSTHACAMGVT